MAHSKQLMFLIAMITLVLMSMFHETNSCFITNCPQGKRSLISQLGPKTHMTKECTRCGPALSGRCFGPNICCSPLFGCNMGGFAASRCALEAYNPSLCSNPGTSCGPNGKGVCALNLTCCTNDGCFMDKSCTQSFPENNNQFNLADLNL